jgi:NAD(P)-dependent dehydrogenase (short-subunit alcohol dehydrogenase family)
MKWLGGNRVPGGASNDPVMRALPVVSGGTLRNGSPQVRPPERNGMSTSRDPGVPAPKSVVVTGANSGIGLATALELAAAGYGVFGTVRDEAKAARLRDAAGEAGTTLTAVVCDVGEARSCERGLADIAEQTGGGPWAVVNNAGYAQGGAVEDVTDELARAQLEVNLIAPARVARLVLPAMRERGDGVIVNVSSVMGRATTPLLGWYCASKHGLEALSNALRVEVAQFGVRVVLIEPGAFGTDIWAGGRDRLPRPHSSAYADAYRRSDAITAGAEHSPDPVWVARTIRVALANPVPLARYLVGVDAAAFTATERLVPTLVTDYMKSLASGLRRSLVPGLPLPAVPRPSWPQLPPLPRPFRR